MACLFVVAMERELKLEFSEHLTEILFILFKDFIYSSERERDRESTSRERGRGRGRSRLPAQLGP